MTSSRSIAVGRLALLILGIGTAPPAGLAEPSATVSAGGITLSNATVTLPSSDRMYPDGPNAEVINNNCLTCHSAGMVLTQPQLNRAEWQGEVTKMVKVYKAPVTPQDAALIVDYLAQLKPAR